MLGLGGMTLNRRPVAACAEIIRQGRTGIDLVDYTGSFEGDILIGSGTVSTLRSCYFGMDILGLAPMHRRAVSAGSIRLIEETEATIAYGLRAAQANVDFLPARIWHETDMPGARPDLKEVASPYSNETYVAVPALVPDVAIIHAWKADAAGNAVLAGDLCLDASLAIASRTTIITAERIVDTAEIEEHEADILGGFVDFVVETPGGARPTACAPEYGIDFLLLADYVESCGEDRFGEFLEANVL